MTNEEVNNQQKKEKKELTKQEPTMCGTNKEETDVTFVQVKFGLNFTEDELLALANEPHSKLAVRTKKYIYRCVKYAAEKYIKENVTKV